MERCCCQNHRHPPETDPARETVEMLTLPLLLPRDHTCVACGTLAAPSYAAHHRILGNRADERFSNKLILCGFGNVPPGCHGLSHKWARIARILGYIVTRHGPRTATLDVPVWYDQPSAGRFPARTGWYLLDDDGGLTGPLDLPAPTERLPLP